MTDDAGPDGGDLRGADAPTVDRALADRDPLPGTRGFAGRLDGALVRDVLGREPLFVGGDGAAWRHDPTDLDDPAPFPAGHVDRGAGREQVWTLPDPQPTADADRAVAAVREAVRQAIADVAATDLAVGFSGGVDSSVVAAGLDAPCYVVGFPGSGDLEAARDAAEVLDVDLRVVELDHDALERGVRAVARATGRTNAMDVAIAAPLFCLAEQVAADGHDALALGQGADELFGGYEKVARAPDDDRTDADTVAGARREVLEGLPAQCARDVPAVRAAGVEPVCPLLDDRVVRAALELPADLLVAGGERKVGFRRAARAFVPESVAGRDKKALQYGTDVATELDRLARQAGFPRREDDHVSRYVASLADM